MCFGLFFIKWVEGCFCLIVENFVFCSIGVFHPFSFVVCFICFDGSLVLSGWGCLFVVDILDKFPFSIMFFTIFDSPFSLEAGVGGVEVW